MIVNLSIICELKGKNNFSDNCHDKIQTCVSDKSTRSPKQLLMLSSYSNFYIFILMSPCSGG